jgi:thiamine biosynthesis lipoprotein
MFVLALRKYAARAVVLALLVGCGGAGRFKQVGCEISEPAPQREVRYVMGTLLDVTLSPPTPGSGRELLAEVCAVAERLDGSLSNYKLDSDTSRFNADRSGAMRVVTPDLYRVIERSQELSEDTEGAFDITVRPLVEMWQRAARDGQLPVERQRREVRKQVGYKKLRRGVSHQVGKSVAGVEIETGGIAKGLAVDEMVSLLKRRGVTNTFINFGRSSMAAIGSRPDGRGWPVVIELEEGDETGTVWLRDETLTVSRDRGAQFVVAGVSYPHIFDPRTLMPAKTSRGVAVRSASAADGEAYTKYLVLRGAPSRLLTDRWQRAEWVVKDRAQPAQHSSLCSGSDGCVGAYPQHGLASLLVC